MTMQISNEDSFNHDRDRMAEFLHSLDEVSSSVSRYTEMLRQVEVATSYCQMLWMRARASGGAGAWVDVIRSPAPGVLVADARDPEGNAFHIEAHTDRP